jgi:hypothetical protein
MGDDRGLDDVTALLGDSPVRRAILIALLREGDHIPAGIRDAIGGDPDLDQLVDEDQQPFDPHTQSVQRQLAELEDMGLVRGKGYGVRMLTLSGERAALQLVEDLGCRVEDEGSGESSQSSV